VVANAQVVVVGTVLVEGMAVVVVKVSPIGGGVCSGVDGMVDSMASLGSGR
jgi:hypothetical protein